jgi:hypothetical protein
MAQYDRYIRRMQEADFAPNGPMLKHIAKIIQALQDAVRAYNPDDAIFDDEKSTSSVDAPITEGPGYGVLRVHRRGGSVQSVSVWPSAAKAQVIAEAEERANPEYRYSVMPVRVNAPAAQGAP